MTARTAWLLATIVGRHDLYAWGVTVSGPTGRARAAALFADEPDQRGPLRTTLLGSDEVHRAAVLADDASAAHELGLAVQHALLTRAHLGALRLGPLPAADPKVDAFAAGLGIARVVDVDPIPVVDDLDLSARAPDAESLLSPSVRRTLRKATNRMRADGICASTCVVTDDGAIRGWLPRLADHHRARDHAHGRVSALDDDSGAALWRGRAEALLDEGLELTLLLLDGILAAYVLGVPDGATYRLLDGRFVDRWTRYAPGRQLETRVVQRVLEDDALSQLDWMTGIAPETLLLANRRDAMVELRLPDRG
jgi:hypothetical protein